MPRVSTEERDRRDQLIFQLYLAGVPYRQIAARPEVRLSMRGVQLAIDRQRSARQGQRDDFGEVAGFLIERYEQLYQVAHRKAMAGELRANDQCRKLLIELSRLHGLDTARGANPSPVGDDDGYDDDGLSPAIAFDPDDELAQFRLP